jgi:hypothetical protein
MMLKDFSWLGASARQLAFSCIICDYLYEKLLVEELVLPTRRVRITAMAVAAADLTVEVMDSELCALITTDLPALVDSLTLRIVVTAGAFGPTPLYIPATLRVMDNVVGFRTFSGLH